MTRIIVVLIAGLFYFTISSAQVQLPVNTDRYQDSLYTVLGSGNTDYDKAMAGFLLCDSWYRKDTVKAKQYLDKAKLFAKSDPFLNSIYFYYKANMTCVTSIEQAETYYMMGDAALSKFDNKEANIYKAKIWHNYGVMQQLKDDNKAFAEILLNKSIPFAKQSADSVYLGKCFFDLGLAFKNMGQNKKVKEYCNIAIGILRKANAPVDQQVAVYITAAETGVLLNELEEARKNLDSAKKILQPFPDSRYFIDYYASEGMYLNVKGEYGESLKSIEKGILMAKTSNLRYNELRLWLQKFYLFFNKKDFSKAKEVLYYLIEQKEMTALSNNALQLFNGMAETHAGLGDMKLAYEWQKKYGKLSDSIYEDRLKNTINELELKFNNAESQKKIALLNIEKDKASLQSKNNRLLNWILGGAGLFLLLTTILAWKYNANIKKLALQKEVNHQQQIKEVQQQQQLQLTQALLHGEERERKRIAGDLHDGLGGMLAGVKINLSRISSHNNASVFTSDLPKVINQLDNSVNELRRIARNMMPETLLNSGLEVALKDICESFLSEKTKLDFQALNIRKDIPQDIQVAIYRIVQELLANAIRHADAGNILVQCSQDNNILYITVEDDGKGFNRREADSKGMGLANVKNRVDYLKGQIEINSSPGDGTIVNIELNVGK
jgi:two-component system, NarL family, sensor kinase